MENACRAEPLQDIRISIRIRISMMHRNATGLAACDTLPHEPRKKQHT